jgi:hypothetical protein
MNRRTARGNRIGLAIVGVVLLLAGAAAAVRGLDLLPDLLGRADAPVTDEPTRDFVADQDWFWPVVAAALILVTVLALRWLLVQTRSGAVGTLRLETDPGRGVTRMPARTLTGAIEDDLDRSPYLSRTRATLTGSRVHPHLRLATSVNPASDAAAVRDRVQEAVDRCRKALEAPNLRTTALLRR